MTCVFSGLKECSGEQLETAMRYVHMSEKMLEEAASKSSPVDLLSENSSKTKKGGWEQMY